jgi:effector-binding domain-containing protein
MRIAVTKDALSLGSQGLLKAASFLLQPSREDTTPQICGLGPVALNKRAILTGHMNTQVRIETVSQRKLAAAHRQVRIGQVATVWRQALDQVWEFLRQNPGLRTDGHNIFLYHHPENREFLMDVDFGVEVTRSFPSSGEVALVETPAGKVASALHVGSYDELKRTHDAIHAWAAANQLSFGGKSWEIYGDWTEDLSKLETRIEYLLS